ncbi:FAD-dependent oxidoreductase [Frankia alni]|uniref:Phytoene dehydrogenase (Phytoene desaturase) n=1 Tax=Frankia alni (strain DSM 45986 / CECT 9034 / ACN14a) TaxID=326424 RepID=Q0RKV0_FRAAA|nr:FAD-dependent oxidoreductase [Frankia alni]CAJ61855.1 Putative phytoene dehydrogenase (Phytoene desaturase) [Frankia alni ACN14a]
MTSDRSTSTPHSGHAVVLGAGIAGLLAARVLSESFDRVSVLDRDDLPGTGDTGDLGSGLGAGLGARRGVPQAGHLHALMDRGREILEELHPGLVTRLVAAGAPTSEALVGGRWYLQGRRVGPVSTGLTSVLASRPLLERELRRRTAALPGVRLLPRTAVIGLVGVGADESVTGVRIRAGAGDGASTVLAADLVVDASGRNSRSLDWLAAAGHPAPPTSRVTVDLGYASRIYQRRPEHLGGDLSVIISTTPGLRGGGAAAVEGDRWIVTLAGLLGEHPPTDDDGFRAFARRLPAPDIADLIGTATPLTDAVPYRFRESVRRHFEAVRRPPDGIVVIGDALCSFNPLYAQGMTVAAQQALVLRDCLSGGLRGLPGRFYRAVGPVLDVAWDMATSSDLRYPAVAGRRTLRGRVTGSYAARAQRRAHRDPAVARTLMRVVHLAEPPTALLRPALAARVLAPGAPRAITPAAPTVRDRLAVPHHEQS